MRPGLDELGAEEGGTQDEGVWNVHPSMVVAERWGRGVEE